MKITAAGMFLCLAILPACKERTNSGTALAAANGGASAEAPSMRLAACNRMDNGKVIANAELTVFREPNTNQIHVYDQLAGLLIPGEFKQDPQGQAAIFSWAPIQGEVHELSFVLAGTGTETVTNASANSSNKTVVKCKVDR